MVNNNIKNEIIIKWKKNKKFPPKKSSQGMLLNVCNFVFK